MQPNGGRCPECGAAVLETVTRNMRRFKCSKGGCTSNGYLGPAKRKAGAAPEGLPVSKVPSEAPKPSGGQGGTDGDGKRESIFFDVYE